MIVKPHRRLVKAAGGVFAYVMLYPQIFPLIDLLGQNIPPGVTVYTVVHWSVYTVVHYSIGCQNLETTTTTTTTKLRHWAEKVHRLIRKNEHDT